MTSVGYYRSGCTEPHCSFVLLLEKLLGGRGRRFLRWIPIDFSFRVTESHTAPIAGYCFFLVASPEVGPSAAAATSHPLLTFHRSRRTAGSEAKQTRRRMNWGNGRDNKCKQQRLMNANHLVWSEASVSSCERVALVLVAMPP